MTKQRTHCLLTTVPIDIEDDDYAASIAQFDGCPYPLHIADVYSEPDARRLVACWNALIDLPQVALDGGWTRAGLEAYGLQMEQRAKEAEAQRGELLKALKVLHSRYVQCIGNEGPEALAARAAIAKVEGGAA